MIIHGECLDEMRKMGDCSIDFIVTDPPYGLHFMGKKWDDTVPNKDIWNEAYRVCKPGSMLAAFGGTRTHHNLMSALEQVGWEIRDCCMFLYGSGFPKSHNKFGLEGYGTALKPAWEPIIICMKPLDGTYAQNVEKWGLGGINIGDSRVGIDEIVTQLRDRSAWHGNQWGNGGYEKPLGESEPRLGRWPANLILDEEAAEMLDRQSGVTKSSAHIRHNTMPKCETLGKFQASNIKGVCDSGGASRFFYCAKASSKERNAGLNSPSSHPTVKPLSLMRYILKLLAPPNNPIVLDPFAGSGSTLCAAKQLGIRHIGIELEKDYCEIAQKRLDHTEKFKEQEND